MHDGRVRKCQRLRERGRRRERAHAIQKLLQQQKNVFSEPSWPKASDESKLHFHQTLHQKNSESMPNAN